MLITSIQFIWILCWRPSWELHLLAMFLFPDVWIVFPVSLPLRLCIHVVLIPLSLSPFFMFISFLLDRKTVCLSFGIVCALIQGFVIEKKVMWLRTAGVSLTICTMHSILQAHLLQACVSWTMASSSIALPDFSTFSPLLEKFFLIWFKGLEVESVVYRKDCKSP